MQNLHNMLSHEKIYFLSFLTEHHIMGTSTGTEYALLLEHTIELDVAFTHTLPKLYTASYSQQNSSSEEMSAEKRKGMFRNSQYSE